MSRPLLNLALGVVLAAHASSAADSPKSVAPAKVQTPVKEADLNTVTLTPQAVQRLGIVTVAVERKSVARARSFGGEAMVRAGASLAVTAPVAGTLRGESVSAGQVVKRSQQLFTLAPILSPTERVNVATALSDAAGVVAGAKAQLDAARVALARAEVLAKSQAGSQRGVDDARAAVAVAEANMKAADARVGMLGSVLQDFDAGKLTTLTVSSPLDGVLTSIRAAPGQQVAGGTLLVEVTSLDPLWLRVPIYAGEASSIQSGAIAHVMRAGARPGGPGIQARPVAAPPSANAAAATVDLFFELPNPGGQFRPGERLTVSLPLSAAETSLVIPWAAVLHDIHGGQWAYEQVAPQTFVRRRLFVERVVGRDAVISSGPGLGAKLVTDGAAELFGTELGGGK